MKKIPSYLSLTQDVAPLAAFRILFGVLMFLASIRFLAKGWVSELYLKPQFLFKYQGFEWVKPLGYWGTHALYVAMAVAFLCIALGFFYRFSAIAAFVLFTYAELLDKTNYLNHYYFVSLVCFMLIFLPASQAYSMDANRLKNHNTLVPKWTIDALKLQLAIVYIYAGIAKLNADWLFNAMPLKLWLPAHSHLPVIGKLLAMEITAFLFSWFGAVYDLFIIFFLLYKPTRFWAYGIVVLFHLTTWLLFPIGMFPFIMIGATAIFFSAELHQKWLQFLFKKETIKKLPVKAPTWVVVIFVMFISVQLALPWRYLSYPGKLFWTEYGYRFSWRVMLMEKAGTAFFYVSEKGKEMEVNNAAFLTKNQEKMMATQPDMILQYAHILKKHYQKKGLKNPKVRAEVYVTLNGSGSRLFLDSSVNLAAIKSIYNHPKLILPF